MNKSRDLLSVCLPVCLSFCLSLLGESTLSLLTPSTTRTAFSHLPLTSGTFRLNVSHVFEMHKVKNDKKINKNQALNDEHFTRSADVTLVAYPQRTPGPDAARCFVTGAVWRRYVGLLFLPDAQKINSA